MFLAKRDEQARNYNQRQKGSTGMKKLFVATVALAVMAIFVSSAQAISISKASIKKDVVSVKGSAAAANSNISWEGANVATANSKGAFKFSGVVPADCVGKLSDGATTIDVAVASCTPTGADLKTGETICYDTAGGIVPCANTGQDGEFQRGRARSYTVDVDGLTITDNTTGLEWEKLCNNTANPGCLGINDVDTKYTWAQAFQKIADLNTANFAGRNDWRLPNMNELQTLTNWGLKLPAIDPVFNDGSTSFTLNDFYWVSNSYQELLSRAYVVGLSDGASDVGNKATGSFLVRAVRGGS